MAKNYTDIWKGFQFRSPTYLDGHIEPYEFDLVKWQEHEPYEVTNFETGEKEMSDRSCFSIATLTWNPKEEWFDFRSVGLRYLEHRIDRLEEWILKFCEFKAIELEGSNYDS